MQETLEVKNSRFTVYVFSVYFLTLPLAHTLIQDLWWKCFIVFLVTCIVINTNLNIFYPTYDSRFFRYLEYVGCCF